MKKNEKKKILYFCHVDWRWIKQRPQFLAELLQGEYEVFVIYPWQNRRKGLRAKEATNVHLYAYKQIPSLGGKVKALKSFSKKYIIYQIKRKIAKLNPDIIWFTHPSQIDGLPDSYQGSIVYDCMDDHISMLINQDEKEKLLLQEQTILSRANRVFVSSEYLKTIIQTRCSNNSNNIELVRNGYNASWQLNEINKSNQKSQISLAYFGTVGRWFDTELLLESLNSFPELQYHLYGPVERGTILPTHERIIYHGVVEHNEIPLFADKHDGLIMPFKICDVVKSVDPVKLYEYIALRKPVIAVSYSEVEHFLPFVNLYQNIGEYNNIVRLLAAGEISISSESEINEFLSKNTWQSRVEQIKNSIREIKQ